MKQGVRQGCPLAPSPILFNTCINELVEELRRVPGGVMLDDRSLVALLYADDVILLLADNPETPNDD